MITGPLFRWFGSKWQSARHSKELVYYREVRA